MKFLLDALYSPQKVSDQLLTQVRSTPAPTATNTAEAEASALCPLEDTEKGHRCLVQKEPCQRESAAMRLSPNFTSEA